MAAIRGEVGVERIKSIHYQRSLQLFDEMIRADDFAEFLTLPAYRYL